MRNNMYKIICMFALSMLSANADVITGVTATATTEDVPYRTASHLVDGSGLAGNQHETYSAERMWLSGATSPQSVVFDLGAVYNVSQIKVWNYNEAGDWPNPGDALVNLGANAVSVTFGTTLNGFTLGGATGTVDSITSFAKASGLGDYTGETFSEPFKARYIKFDIASSHGHPLNRVGLSEIQFAGTAAPGPPITGVTATATTESGDRTAANLVDDFGLSGGMHSTGPWQMWLSGAAIPQSVVFDLGALYDVNQLKVWNYNEAGDWPNPGDALVNLGANAVSVTYGTTLIGSTLGGATGTVASIASFAKASGASNYAGQTFNAPFQARYVKFDIASNYGHPLDGVGLSEVQFLGTAAPGPTTGGSVYVYDKTLPASARIYTTAEKETQLANGRQVLEEMHMAIADGEPSYTIVPGVYRFEGPRPIVFYKVKNFTLFARNVEFIFDDLETGDTTLWFEECENVTVQGPLIIDADPIPYSQATVLSSDIATGLVTLEIMTGYDVPPNGGRSVYYAFTPNGRFIPQAYNELSNFTLTNSGSRIITAQGGAENFSTCLKPGNLVVIGEGQGTPVMFHSSVSLIDVDIHTGAGAGWGPSNGSMSFKGVRGIPRPGTNRLKGSFAPQMSSVSGEVLFENCVFQNCNDDALNYQGGSMTFMAYRQDTPQTLTMYGGEFAVGSEIEIYDSTTFGIKSKGIVQNIEVLNDAAMETDARVILNSVTKLRDMDLGDMRKVTFDNEMVMMPGDIASNRSERAENLIIRNCYFYGSGHSIVAQSFKNALFENNVVETVNSGLMFVAGMWWWESAGLENITIRNNKFIDTATSFSRGSFAINIGNPDPAPPAVNYTATHLVRNVLIEGNTIRSSKEGGVEVKNAENIVIRNNTFYNVDKAIVNLERVNYATIKSNYADNLIEVPFTLENIENVEIDANILSNAKIDETNLATVTNGKNVSMGVNQYSMGWIEPPDMPVFPLPIDDLGIRAPNGGESWICGTNHMIYWIPGGTGNVKIDLMQNGSFFASIAANTPNTGSYDWAIPANHPPGSAYRIRITSLAQPAVTDTSEADFAIAPVPPIVWGTPKTIAGDTDVSTTGSFKYAYHWASGDQTVNGVTFTGTTSATDGGSDVGLTGFSAQFSGFTGTTTPFTGLSTSYQATLAGSPYNVGETATVTLKNLTPGNQYAVQVWIEDARHHAIGRFALLTSSGGNSVALDYNSTDADGGVGQYSIGTFTASAAKQAFTISASESAQLSALQVRDLGIITWSPPTTIADDTDVSTYGTFKYAYHWASGDQTVNGVTFTGTTSTTAGGSDVGLAGFYWHFSGFTGTTTPFTGLSTPYRATLAGSPYNGGETATVTLKNLTSGNKYAVQVWIEDARHYGIGRFATLTSSGGNSVALDYNSTDADGGVGQYSIGTFTANAVTKTFTIAASAGGSTQLNALQVRDLGDDRPVATAQSVTTEEDAAKAFTLAGTDLQGRPLTYNIVTQPASGTLGGTPPILTYTPNANFNGADSFTFKVNNGSLDSTPATVSIIVNAVNDPPAFAINPFATAGATESLAYTGQTLAGSATDADAGDTITYSKVSGPAWLAVAPDGTLSGTPPTGSAGLNTFTVCATDSAAAIATATLQITVTAQPLPLPWLKGDIGTGMLAGSVTHNAGIFTQAGSGVIGSTSDKLNFAYQTLTGDGEIIARISVLQNTGTSSRVGVMIRDTLAANSKQIFMGMTGTNAYRWLRRTTTGGGTSSTNSSTGTVPNTWVRLVRSGTTITAYKSSNGTSWTSVGSTAGTTFASTCYIGLAVSSGSNTTLNTSQFSNVTVTP